MSFRAVIFDIGGVLSHRSDLAPQRKWEIRLGLSDGQLADLIFSNPVTQRAMVGAATPDDVWAMIAEQIQLPRSDILALRAEFWHGHAWNTDLLAFCRTLRPRYKTAVLSDAWIDARTAFQSYINSELFDVIVYSAEEGIKKPNPEIFLRTLVRLGVAPKEAIYIDDRRENVDAAQVLGIQGILFTNTSEVRTTITTMLQGASKG